MALSPTRALVARRSPALPWLDWLAVGIRADLLVVSGLLTLAAAVRWPHLLLSPQFPSIGDTVLLALDVADGRAFYLRDSAPYLGAPFLWILAAVYRVFGPSLEATQLVAFALGTLTIVPTYLLGREVGGRGVGSIGAALLATSGAHTVVSSHVALSHSLTPLVATITLWLLARAARVAGEGTAARVAGEGAADGTPAARLVRGGRLLAGAGLLAGLTLQTHPTAAPLLAGAAVGVVLMRPRWLRTRWPVVALALVVVGYGTLLASHVASRFDIVADIQGKQERYLDDDDDAGEASSRGVYVNNLEQLSLSTVRLISGTILDRESPSDYLRDPWVLVPAGLAVAGLTLARRNGAAWLVPAVMLAMLLPPALSGKYRPILDGRYLMPLVPVLFVAIGLAMMAAARVVMATGAARQSGAATMSLPPQLPGIVGGSWPAASARVLALVALAAGTVAVVAHPIRELNVFYKESQEDGFSNALYLRTFNQVVTARQSGEEILLDPRLVTVKSTGGGKASSSFDVLLALSRVPSTYIDGTAAPTELTGRLAILHRATADYLDDTVQLTPLDGRRANGKDSPSYRAYRIGGPATAAR